MRTSCHLGVVSKHCCVHRITNIEAEFQHNCWRSSQVQRAYTHGHKRVHRTLARRADTRSAGGLRRTGRAPRRAVRGMCSTALRSHACVQVAPEAPVTRSEQEFISFINDRTVHLLKPPKNSYHPYKALQSLKLLNADLLQKGCYQLY